MSALSIRKHEEDTVAEPTDAQDPAAGAGAKPEQTAGPHVSEYTTQTGDAAAGAAARPPARKPVVTGSALGTGRRKEAIARVRIKPGSGKYLINDRSLDEYFPNKVHQQLINEPFVTLGADDAFDVVARITGGGVTGQAGALRLGIARALQLVDPESRPALKRAGFLTRDARVKERKKAGLKKARKAPQYSKR
jgi:small subunit ribosomal protein S9